MAATFLNCRTYMYYNIIYSRLIISQEHTISQEEAKRIRKMEN